MQTLRTARTLRPLRIPTCVLQQARMSSTATDPPKKKKPSPYRLPKLHAFQESFGPLASAGWQLAATSSSAANPAAGEASVSDPLELESKRLVQSYQFSDYAKLLEMMSEIGRLVQAQDVSVFLWLSSSPAYLSHTFIPSLPLPPCPASVPPHSYPCLSSLAFPPRPLLSMSLLPSSLQFLFLFMVTSLTTAPPYDSLWTKLRHCGQAGRIHASRLDADAYANAAARDQAGAQARSWSHGEGPEAGAGNREPVVWLQGAIICEGRGKEREHPLSVLYLYVTSPDK